MILKKLDTKMIKLFSHLKNEEKKHLNISIFEIYVINCNFKLLLQKNKEETEGKNMSNLYSYSIFVTLSSSHKYVK